MSKHRCFRWIRESGVFLAIYLDGCVGVLFLLMTQWFHIMSRRSILQVPSVYIGFMEHPIENCNSAVSVPRPDIHFMRITIQNRGPSRRDVRRVNLEGKKHSGKCMPLLGFLKSFGDNRKKAKCGRMSDADIGYVIV